MFIACSRQSVCFVVKIWKTVDCLPSVISWLRQGVKDGDIVHLLSELTVTMYPEINTQQS